MAASPRSEAIRQASDRIRVWREKPQVFVREVFGATPDGWQDEVLEIFPTQPRIAMKACKGPGKAQPVDTLIPTPDGMRRMGDLKLGDRVFAGDGSVTRVTGVYDRGVRPVYHVSFDDGSSTYACGEHLWKIKGRTERRHGTWSVLSTDQILERGVRERNGRWRGRHFEIPRQGAMQMPEASLDIHPYVMGVWLGDGSRRSAMIAAKPTEHIRLRIDRCGYRTKSVGSDIRVYGLMTRLRAMGLLTLYSHQRHIPEAYKWASIEQRTELLRGLMDTDGGIDADGHSQFASTSVDLANDVVWLVRSLGGIAYVTLTVKMPFYYGADGKRIACKPCYRVVVRTPFNPFTLPNKVERWRDPYRNASSLRYLTRKLDAIEPAGEAHCVCIAVEHSDRLYLTEDFIVTHNTCLLSWLCWNFLATRPHPKIAATAISADNLKDNLWSEMAMWLAKSPFLKSAFTWRAERIVSNEHPETWWMSARSWSRSANAEQQGNTLAGLHAPYVMIVLDESGGIPDAVMANAEGIGSSAREWHIVQAGNPTHLEGPLYRACTTERSLWYVREITSDPDDPKRTSRVSVQWAREQIQKYGADHPWVLVNVFGRFPPASFNSLIGPDEVNAAMGRHLRLEQYGFSAKTLGVDVARFGDDRSVVFPRQGLATFDPIIMRNADEETGAGAVANKWHKWNADGCFIDATGGYASGWLALLRQLGRHPIEVQFAGKPNDPKYYNKRAEIWFEMCEWVKGGGALPNTPEVQDIVAELTTPTYTFKGDKFLVEEKDQIKTRLGRSPDLADALATTFAQPVHVQRDVYGQVKTGHVSSADHDPFKDF